MTGPPVQVPPPAGAHLVLYDGVCGLCNRVVQFLLERDRHEVFVFAPLQSATGRAAVARFSSGPGEDSDGLTTLFVVADYGAEQARVLSRSSAALFMAGELGWPWRMAIVLRILPLAIRDRVYDVIARSRYRIFGRFEHCPMPRPEFRSRFIDI